MNRVGSHRHRLCQSFSNPRLVRVRSLNLPRHVLRAKERQRRSNQRENLSHLVLAKPAREESAITRTRSERECTHQ